MNIERESFAGESGFDMMVYMVLVFYQFSGPVEWKLGCDLGTSGASDWA